MYILVNEYVCTKTSCPINELIWQGICMKHEIKYVCKRRLYLKAKTKNKQVTDQLPKTNLSAPSFFLKHSLYSLMSCRVLKEN